MFSLKPHHTFHLESAAKNIEFLTSVEQLSNYVGQQNNRGLLILGSGSNSLFLDDYQGTVVINQLKGIEVTEIENDYVLKVCGGEDWHEFVSWTLGQGYFGLENLALIPGTVGACPIQNIGAYGVEVAKFITQVEYFDLISGELKVLKNSECEFAYRDSVFKHELVNNAVITCVVFNLPKRWEPVVSYGELAALNQPSAEDIFHKVIEVRKAKLPDPNDLGNSGSFFKNPIVSKGLAETLKAQYESIPVYPVSTSEVKLAAGWLIDRAGLKGYQMENVAVHDKQALVLVNHSGNASGTDLVKLASFVQQQVMDKFSVWLEPEVRMFAGDGATSLNRGC